MTMEDDLMLGLIANQKKMQRSASMASVSGVNYVKEAFQILEAKALNNDVVKTYPKEFADFLVRNAGEIVGAFERKMGV